MLKEIFSWFYSRDFTFWQNVGHLAVILALLAIGILSVMK